jgi:hypothetical protein
MRYKNSLKQLGLFSFFVLSLAACKKPNEGVGADLLPSSDELFALSNDSTPLLAETYAESTSKLLSDHLTNLGSALAGFSNNLIGTFNDPVFGKVKATSYVQFDKSLPPTFTTQTAVDSVVLSLVCSDTLYGNRLPMSVEVNWLLQRPYRFSFYQANDVLPAAEENIVLNGYTTVRPPQRGNANKAMRIRLTREAGELLIREAQRAQSGVTNFLDEVKGLKISSTSTDGQIVSFYVEDIGTKITVYYRDRNEQTGFVSDQKSYDFLFNANCEAYTHIEYDKSGTPLQNISTDTPIDGQQLAYVQSIGGAYVKIDFSQVDWLKEFPGATINNARLIVPFESSNYYAVHSLFLFDKLESGSFSVEVAETAPRNAAGYYELNITRYIQDYLNGILTDGVMYLRPNLRHNYNSGTNLYVSRSVLHGPEFSNDKTQNMRLAITYTID